MREVVEPGGEGDVGDRAVALQQHTLHLLDAQGVQVVDHGGAGIEAGGKGRSGSGPPVREFVDAVVVQVVQKSQTVKAHGVGLLRDRRRNHAF